MSIVINTANIHAGGAVQVAASFIREAAHSEEPLEDTLILLSSEVERNLKLSMPNPPARLKTEKIDIRGATPFRSRFKNLTKKSNIVFTVFGPLYSIRPHFTSIIGFAQAWIIYPRNECYSRIGLIQRIIYRLKFGVQAYFVKRADAIIVELEHVKAGLIRELGIHPDKIHVVHSCVSRIYGERELWAQAPVVKNDDALMLGFIGRNYIHKNTSVFPEVADILLKKHNINARFYVTFTDEEWNACTEEFKRFCVNVGALDINQCPDFYEKMDAVVFPSLLESFSITPLEAMTMRRTLFASDRPFNRDICGDFAVYFDPASPEDIAEKIKDFTISGPNYRQLDSARDHALSFSNPAHRSRRYFEIIRQISHHSNK